MSADKPLAILAISTAKPGMTEKLRAEQLKLVTETRKEAGCLRYELQQSLEDGRTLIFVETWESEALWQAHMDGPAIAKFRASGARDCIEMFTLYKLEVLT